MEKNTKNNKEE